MQSIFITGANRGIGLALARAYLTQGEAHVFAGSRTPAKASELKLLAASNPETLTIVPVDINEGATVDGAFQMISRKTDTLDLLINNAGIYPDEGSTRRLGELEAAAMNHILATNAVSPLIVTQTFLPLLRKSNGAKIVMMSSHRGSITRASAGAYGYSMSKAAMNMAAAQLAAQLKADGITVLTLHPGHVRTAMGGSSAPILPDESATSLMQLIEGATIEQSGQFLNYNGEHLPW